MTDTYIEYEIFDRPKDEMEIEEMNVKILDITSTHKKFIEVLKNK